MCNQHIILVHTYRIASLRALSYTISCMFPKPIQIISMYRTLITLPNMTNERVRVEANITAPGRGERKSCLLFINISSNIRARNKNVSNKVFLTVEKAYQKTSGTKKKHSYLRHITFYGVYGLQITITCQIRPFIQMQRSNRHITLKFVLSRVQIGHFFTYQLRVEQFIPEKKKKTFRGKLKPVKKLATLVCVHFEWRF